MIAARYVPHWSWNRVRRCLGGRLKGPGGLLQLLWGEPGELSWNLGAGRLAWALRETGPQLGLLPRAQEAAKEGMREKLRLRFCCITRISSYCLKQRREAVTRKSTGSGDTLGSSPGSFTYS